VQHWVRRARLSLAMMEQLDLTGRTGELARAFGIDFFSVLTRGSQYRVESMLARLAHTQNYLLPTPSKDQVPHARILSCSACQSLRAVCTCHMHPASNAHGHFLGEHAHHAGRGPTCDCCFCWSD
jgi:hypothetical protein